MPWLLERRPGKSYVRLTDPLRPGKLCFCDYLTTSQLRLSSGSSLRCKRYALFVSKMLRVSLATLVLGSLPPNLTLRKCSPEARFLVIRRGVLLAGPGPCHTVRFLSGDHNGDVVLQEIRDADGEFTLG